LADPELLRKNLTTLASYIKSSRPTKHGGEIMLPGEPEQKMRVKGLSEGMEIEPATWASILEVAASLNVAVTHDTSRNPK
jgi:hydroxycarboxylate dehydrogenase B